MTAATRTRGASLVELMIGLTAGLFVLAGASTVMVGQLADHRRLMLETRTEQDLRAIAELMQRELRHAGAWPHAWRGLWSPGNPEPLANPYAPVSVADGGDQLLFRVSAAVEHPGVVEDDVYSPSSELRGFELRQGVLRGRVGSNWQPLSDPQTLRITHFSATVSEAIAPLAGVCAHPCDGIPDCPPKVSQRQLRIRLDAEAAHDPAVKRSLDFTMRLQADQFHGVCPP